jgi:hypothetical protein
VESVKEDKRVTQMKHHTYADDSKVIGLVALIFFFLSRNFSQALNFILAAGVYQNQHR